MLRTKIVSSDFHFAPIKTMFYLWCHYPRCLWANFIFTIISMDEKFFN